MSGACRLCGKRRFQVFADLGATPLANAYLRREQLAAAEPYYPLKALVCESCFLVQVEIVVDPRSLFSTYAYFSSYSDSLVASSRVYAERMTARLDLKPGDSVVEVASNDGYLLQHFLGRGVEVLGIEPAANVAEVAAGRGIRTLVRFFGAELARELAGAGYRPRLIVANNVVGHVPDLHDFLSGLKILLAPGGLITLEFHHLLNLVTQRQFDTIYHEHFQYLSLHTARAALDAHGLTLVDVELLPAQGGSLRAYARHREDPVEEPSPGVAGVLAQEQAAGLCTLAPYLQFAAGIGDAKLGLLSFLVNARIAGKSVVCYGAAAKGNTLLNYCGVRADLIDYVVDRSPAKQGLFLPGSRIPIYDPARVMDTKPDYLLLLAWNLRDEIEEQMAGIREWGGQFVLPVPEMQVLS